MKYLATILLLVLVLLCLQVTSAAPQEESETLYIYDADAIVDVTTYYFIALFQYDNTVLNGTENPFKTSREPRPPTVTTKNATNITTASATLNMTYGFMAHRSVQVQFKYKAEGASAWDETGWVSKTRSSSHSFSESIAGLSSGTTYYFTAQLKYDSAMLNGTENSFTTSSESRAPTVSTKNAANITTASATLNMTYDFMDYNSVHVQFRYKAEGANAWDETGWVAQSDSGTHSFSESIAGLSSGTTHYFMAQLKYDGAVLNGTESSFTTSSESRAPTVSTKNAINITTASATLNMAYDFMDYSSVHVQFRYKAEGASVWNETGWVAQTGSGTHSFSEPIADLSSNMTYYFSAQLKYDGTVFNGTEISFTTIGEPRAPTVSTENATNITTASTTLNMAYDFRDYSSVHVQFKYKAEAASGWDGTGWVSQTGSGTHSFSESIAGLSSNTTHYFMAQLKYDGTVLNGTEVSFTTSGEPRAPTVSTKKATNITAASATLNMTYDFRDYNSVLVQFWYKAEGVSEWNETGWVAQSGSGSYSFSEPIAGLYSNKTYYFSAQLKYDSTALNGTENSFTTSGEPRPPTVTTENATNITTASATLSLAYVFMDDSSVQVQFKYKAEGASAWDETGWVAQSGSGTHSFSESIAGLSSGTTHYFMAQLKSDGTVLNGTEVAFTTSEEARPPAVTTKNATNITAAAATLNMAYDFMDYSSVHVQFKYKAEGASAWNETGWVSQTGSGTHSFSESIAGLSSNMTYYFMAQLKYASAVFNSTEISFTTSGELRQLAKTILIYNADAVINLTASTPPDDVLDSADALAQEKFNDVFVHLADASLNFSSSTPPDDVLDSADAPAQENFNDVFVHLADASLNFSSSTPPDDVLDSADAPAQENFNDVFVHLADAIRDFDLITVETPPELQIGDIVKTNAYLHVRNIVDWNNPLDVNNLIFTMHPPDAQINPPWDVGKIIDGPKTDDRYGYTWWKIEWDNGETGWSAEGPFDNPSERWLVKSDKPFIKTLDLEDAFNYQADYELDHAELQAEEKKEEVLQNVMKYAKAYKISPALIMAVIRQESDFIDYQEHPGEDLDPFDVGYMQVSYIAANDTYKEYTGDEYKGTKEQWETTDGLDPETNIKYGVRYLRIQHDRIADGCSGYEDVYGDILKSTVSAYNAGHPVFKTSTKDVRTCYVLGARCKYESGYEGPNPEGEYKGVIEGKSVGGEHRGYKFFLSVRGAVQPQYKPNLTIPVYTPFSQQAHTGTELTYTINVTNEGTVTDTLDLNVSDEKHWVQRSDLSDTSVRLAPGDFKHVHLHVTVKEEATDKITITGTSRGDSSKTSDCWVKALGPLEGCGLFAAILSFCNIDTQEHALNFNVPDYVKISDTTVALSPSKSESVNVVFDPKPSESDIHTIHIDVTDTKIGDSARIPIKFPEYEITATSFDMATDSYRFPNWMKWSFNITGYDLDLYGYCSGMSWTSILYFCDLITRPNNAPNTYSLTEEDSETINRIKLYNWQFYKLVNFLDLVFPDLSLDKDKEYLELETNINGGNPMLLVTYKHVVVAYKIVRDADKAYIFVYDNEEEYLYDISKDDFYMAFPYATYNFTSHEFKYGSASSFLAVKADAGLLHLFIGNEFLLRFMCPVNITIADQYGRLISDDGTNEIPDATIIAGDGQKLFYLPAELTYLVNITAYGSGEFTTETVCPFGDNTVSLNVYDNISITENTHATLDLAANEVNPMKIDYDGDGTIDAEMYPNENETIVVNQPPIASFSYSPAHPMVNELIAFNAIKSDDPDGTITNYGWNFGDGDISNTPEPIITHSYVLAGEYTVDLTVTDDDGATNATAKMITVSGMLDLLITHKWLCWPDNCTICYNVTNTGDGTAPACHNTTLYVDGVAVAHDHVPVDLAPGESYIGCFDDYTWTYTPPSDNITVCADNSETLDELDETNNCLTNIWMCGDVNGDGKVTMSDVRKVFNRYLDPNYPLDLTWAADVNCDGKVSMSDVRKVFNRYLDPGYELNCCCERNG